MFSEAIYMYREEGQKTERTKVRERVKGQNEKNKKQQYSYLIVKLQQFYLLEIEYLRCIVFISACFCADALIVDMGI